MAPRSSERPEINHWDVMARLDGFRDDDHINAVIDWYGRDRFFAETKSTAHLQEFYAKLRHDYDKAKEAS